MALLTISNLNTILGFPIVLKRSIKWYISVYLSLLEFKHNLSTCFLISHLTIVIPGKHANLTISFSPFWFAEEMALLHASTSCGILTWSLTRPTDGFRYHTSLAPPTFTIILCLNRVSLLNGGDEDFQMCLYYKFWNSLLLFMCVVMLSIKSKGHV